jgi:hypothetical protein
VLLRRARGWRAPLQLQAQAPCATRTPAAALDALGVLLAGSLPADLTVLLSNHFVQYLLLPWRAEVTQPAEFMAFAAICFDETFGSVPGGRAILHGRESAMSPRIAAAVEAGWLARLRAEVAASALRLVSVQPYLSAVFDRLPRRLERRDFIFVVAEPTRACLLVAGGGRWRTVRNTAVDASPESLSGLIAREARLAGLADEGLPPILLHAPGRPGLRLPPCEGEAPRSVSLSGEEAGGEPCDPLLAMALAAA